VRRFLSLVLSAAALLWLVATLTFFLVRLAPGDATMLLVAPDASAEELARQRAAFGLEGSLPAQYGRWLAAVLRGDLGTSLARAQPVVTVIAEALPYSLWLGGVSLSGSVLFGVLLGGWQARRAGSRGDTVATILATAAYAAPHFWLALGLVVLSTTGAAVLGMPAWARLPAFGVRTAAVDLAGWAALGDLLRHSVLPLLVLTVTGAAAIARYARGTLREAGLAPHVAHAVARGLPPSRVRRDYVLRNALPPIVVLVGLALPGVVAGSVFVEQVFAWPGLGRTMLSAIAARDTPVVLGITLVYGAVVITSNLLADLTLLVLDPRRRTRDGAST
jgi:peptide/nickel transport system permease protein